MDDVNTSLIKNKIISGVAAFTGRTLVMQLITLFSTFVLTVLLNPSAFGVFFVVSAFISFLTYFSDIGGTGTGVE
jgi:O-antigen/teichoic acid export membrane protein